MKLSRGCSVSREGCTTTQALYGKSGMMFDVLALAH